MSAAPTTRDGWLVTARAEGPKVVAFLRRDLLEAWSYRMAFVTDAVTMALQAVLFFYVGKLVDSRSLPEFGGEPVTYFEFAIVGIAISMVMAVGMFRAAAAFRKEQLIGTLEVLLMTPTSPATIQLGSVLYDLLYVPLRTGIFFVAVSLAADVHINASGILPALVILMSFIPFVWGLGILYAGWTITFKVTGGGILISLLTLTSGAYFPLSVMPDWIQTLADINPLTTTVDTLRETLLGDASWGEVGSTLTILLPASLLTLALGVAGFRTALQRERRRGTLGLY